MPPIRKHHQVTFNNHRVFDPWNSSSTGHQRGETSAGTAWRRTREEKLALQFSSFSSGDRERGDRRDCGYGDDDGEWVWMNDHPSLGSGNGNESVKESGQRDIRDMFSVGKGSSSSSSFLSGVDSKKSCLSSSSSDITTTTKENQDQAKNSPQIQEATKEDQDQNQKQNPPKIFANLTIHLNAASSPLISDHALRHLLVAHGASLSLGVSRRVTHIIVGRPNTSFTSTSSTSTSSSTTGRDESRKSISGAGGGLSASKLQKEIAKAGCRGFRVVGVEWFVLFFLFHFLSEREIFT